MPLLLEDGCIVLIHGYNSTVGWCQKQHAKALIYLIELWLKYLTSFIALFD